MLSYSTYYRYIYIHICQFCVGGMSDNLHRQSADLRQSHPGTPEDSQDRRPCCQAGTVPAATAKV